MDTFAQADSNEPDLASHTRIGKRTWGKLYHEINVGRFLHPRSLHQMRSEAGEELAKVVKVPYLDPKTGQTREFEELVEVDRDVGEKYKLRKAADLWEVLCELVGLPTNDYI